MLLCLTTPGLQAQHGISRYRNVPADAYVPDALQIRLSPAALKAFPDGNIPLQGNRLEGIPALDAIWKTFGFTGFHRVVTVPLQPDKNGLDPSAQPVLRWIKIRLSKPENLLPALDALQAIPQWVEVAEPVFHVELYDDKNLPYFEAQWFPNDSLLARQWHYHNTGQTGGTPDADIDLPEAWDIEQGHPDVLVAVMDNGVDTAHVDLRPNLSALRGYNFYSDNAQLVPGNHGSHTSGTIGAVNQNVSWVSGIAGGDGTSGTGIRLLSCQIFGVPSGSGGIENAFVWSAQNGAAISNNSWGYIQPNIFNQSVLDAIDFFIERGGGSVLKNGLVIFSGGNGGDYAQRWPGVYSRVIGVTATNHQDIRSWYSTYHEELDIAAPGGELNTSSGSPLVNGGRGGILSTIVQAAGAVAYQQGTSMAAPHVSGVAALVASHGRGRLSADDVKSILLTQVDPVDALQEPFYRNKMGTGRLNAYKALARVQALVQAPFVAPPVQFTAQQTCDAIMLRWQKNASMQNVMIAVSTQHARGGLFGIPSGSYAAGDSLPGGGTVVYQGSETSFSFGPVKEGAYYYFKIWSADGSGNYSMGIVSGAPVAGASAIDSFTVQVNCYQSADLTWKPRQGCISPEVLVAHNTINDFGEPSGSYAPGDSLGSAIVLYRGTASSFLHQLSVPADSLALWYKLWPIQEDGGYGNPIMVSTSVPAALESAFPVETDTTFIVAGWQRDTCFRGDVLVAFNTEDIFSLPSGDLQPGDVLPGGEGTILYRGPSDRVTHSGLTTNTLYYYAVWPVLENGYGYPQYFHAKTLCFGNAFALPFSDSIGPSSLLDCALDTLGFRNFTAGPWPQLSVVSVGIDPNVMPYAGRYMLKFNSYDTRETNEVWMTTPKLSSKDIPLVDVAFRWYEDGSDYNGDFFKPEGVTLEWSPDNVNWQTVITYPRIPEYGGNRWKYKQVTLPREAGNRDALFVRWKFRSAWGFNCYLDEIRVFATTPKLPDGSYSRAAAQFSDKDGFTHYYDSSGSLLMSIALGSETIGHVDEALAVGAGGNSGVQLMPAVNNYVRNPGGWAVTGKYWAIENWATPSSNIILRQYVQQSDLEALRQMAFTRFTPPATTQDTLRVQTYHVRGVQPGNASPATGHNGVQIAADFGKEGYWQFDYRNGENDSLHFSSGDFIPGWLWADQLVQRAGSGGAGMGSPKGNGALAPYWVSIAATRLNKTTQLQWTTGFERLWLQMKVERTLQGTSSFSPIGMVFPVGYSQTGASYTFADMDLLPNGVYHYRVVATDAKGQVFISPLAGVTVDDTRGVLVFPNPALNGNFTVFGESTMDWLRLTDVLGRIVYTASPGNTRWQVQAPFLTSGVYFLQVQMASGTRTQKILIAR